MMIERLDAKFIGKGEVRGFCFEKAYENKRGYIYKVETNNSTHYEVFYKKLTAICLDFEKRIYSETDKKECYPKSRDFGRWAWTVRTIESGIERLEKSN